MKKIILIGIFCIISTNLFSQTFKLESVFSNTEIYLSHWKVLEGNPDFKTEIFSLWGYQQYYDDAVNGAYEVEYFKGNPNDTYNFLNKLLQFTEKYKKEDNVLTSIFGVKVKTLNKIVARRTLVFARDGKVAYNFNENQFKKMLSEFVSFCEKQNIDYK